jgi:hypothetical protein
MLPIVYPSLVGSLTTSVTAASNMHENRNHYEFRMLDEVASCTVPVRRVSCCIRHPMSSMCSSAVGIPRMF